MQRKQKMKSHVAVFVFFVWMAFVLGSYVWGFIIPQVRERVLPARAGEKGIQ